jgi:hypothetical protein
MYFIPRRCAINSAETYAVPQKGSANVRLFLENAGSMRRTISGAMRLLLPQ